jgi:hypothetical protein
VLSIRQFAGYVGWHRLGIWKLGLLTCEETIVRVAALVVKGTGKWRNLRLNASRADESKAPERTEEECMAKRQGVASKLFAVLGGAGLAIGVCTSRATAGPGVPPPWTNANYANRYVCNDGVDDAMFTGVEKINPNGGGGYTAGTANASISGVDLDLFNPSLIPTKNFCSYSLDTGHSAYAIDQHGIGVETLSWMAATSNSKSCPGDFVETRSIVIRNNTTSNNTVPRTDFAGEGFMDDSSPGQGFCLK